MYKFASIKKLKIIKNPEIKSEEFETDSLSDGMPSVTDSVPEVSEDLWFEKYRPKTLEDIVVSDAKIQTIRQWFYDFEAHNVEKKTLVFTGPPGTGKTSLAHIVLKEFGYSVKEFNASDIRSQSQVKESMYDLICVSNVTRSTIPIGIIMDEVDGMLTGDRGGIDELISFIKMPSGKKKTGASANDGKKQRIDVWGPPIICICNTGNAKQNTLTDLRKHCLEINFQKPISAEMARAMERVIIAENLIIDASTREDIIKYAQGDYRRLMCLLQHLYSRYGNTISKENLISSYHIFCQKEQDLHVRDNIKRIFNKQFDFMTVLGVYYRDKSKTPMVMHQNYIKAIDGQKTTSLEKIDNAIKVIDSLVDSDIIEKTMYNTQGWHLQTIQGLTCCYIPSYYINKYDKIRTIDISWTEVLGTSSHTQSSKKKIQEIMYMISKKNNYNNTDIQFLCDIVLFLILNNREKEAISLLSTYNLLDPKIIDKLSSIVKLNKYSDIWKDKKTKEKGVFEKLIESAQSTKNDVVELGTTKIDLKLNPASASSSKPLMQFKPKTIIKSTAPEPPDPSPQKEPVKIKIKPSQPVVIVPPKASIMVTSKKNPKRTLVLVKKS